MGYPGSASKLHGGKYGHRDYDPNNRSLRAMLSGTGAWHPQNLLPKVATPQYSQGLTFGQQSGQIMTPQTGPAQTTKTDIRRENGQFVDLSRSGFVNPTQGNQPVATPFDRRLPRPQTIPSITAGNPMTQPLQQGYPNFTATPEANQRGGAGQRYLASGGGQAQPDLNSPYFRARRARNQLGLGSPYVQGGASSNEQLQEMYGGQADDAILQLAQQRSAQQQQGQMPQQAQPMQQTPMQRLGFADPSGRQMPAATREQGLARMNGGLGGTQTFQQAIADRDQFNKGGHQFGGAKLSEQNGRAQFVEKERPTRQIARMPTHLMKPGTFRPGANGEMISAEQSNAEALASMDPRDLKYRQGLQDMENRGIGYVDPNTGAFIGRGARTFASDGQGMGAYAGRLAAGGVTPTDMSSTTLSNNAAQMQQRMAADRAQRLARVQQNAAAESQDRRARMAGPTPWQRLMQDNPAAALAIQQQQMQQAGAERIAQLQNDGREKVAGIEAGQNQQRNGIAGIAALINSGMPPDQALRVIAAQQGGGGQGQFDPNLLKPEEVPKMFAGGNLSEQQYNDVKEFAKDATPEELKAKLETLGLSGDQLAVALNQVKPPNWFGEMFGQTRTADDPSGWGNYFRGISIDPKTGKKMRMGEPYIENDPRFRVFGQQIR